MRLSIPCLDCNLVALYTDEPGVKHLSLGTAEITEWLHCHGHGGNDGQRKKRCNLS